MSRDVFSTNGQHPATAQEKRRVESSDRKTPPRQTLRDDHSLSQGITKTTSVSQEGDTPYERQDPASAQGEKTRRIFDLEDIAQTTPTRHNERVSLSTKDKRPLASEWRYVLYNKTIFCQHGRQDTQSSREDLAVDSIRKANRTRQPCREDRRPTASKWRYALCDQTTSCQHRRQNA